MQRADDRHHRSCARLAGSARCQRDQAAARDAGDLVVAGRRTGCCSTPASAAPTTGGATSSAIRIRRATSIGVVEQCAERLRRQRRHSRSGLPLAGLRDQLLRLVQLARRRPRTSPVRMSLKVGYQGTLLTDDRTWSSNNQNLTYRVNNGVPNQLTQSISPYVNNARADWHAFFVQEQWTLGRLTLQGALRFDRSTSWFPEQQEGPSRFLPTAIVTSRDQGRRQLQGHHAEGGRGLRRVRERQDGDQVQPGQVSRGRRYLGELRQREPDLRLPGSAAFGVAGVTRTWTDANSNFSPDCDLLNPLANDRPHHRRRLLRPDLESAVRPERPDQQLRSGAAHGLGRPLVGLERSASPFSSRLLPRASVEVAYTRRSYQRLHGQRQPARRSRPTTRSTASSRRSIRGCPMAAAIRSPASSTSSRPSPARSAISSPTPASSETGITTSTASTSR